MRKDGGLRYCNYGSVSTDRAFYWTPWVSLSSNNNYIFTLWNLDEQSQLIRINPLKYLENLTCLRIKKKKTTTSQFYPFSVNFENYLTELHGYV